MDTIDIGLWLFVLLIFIISYWYLTVPKNLPPGSAGIPILGYIPFLSKTPYLAFEKLGGKYGNVFHLYIGSRLVVVLNDYKAIREAFVNQADHFVGRPPDILKTLHKHNLGVVVTDGEYWKQHRRFILTNLKDYGVGKPTLEPMLLNEIEHCLQEIRNKNGKSFAIRELLAASAANCINILLSGKRFHYDHPIMKELLQRGTFSTPTLNFAMFFPWITMLPRPYSLLKQKSLRNLLDNHLENVGKIIQIAKDEYQEGQRENYIDAFLTERNARLKLNKKEDIFTDLALAYITRDLIVAGTETTSTTMHWTLLYMTIYPEIQRKVQREIDQVIGQERQPSYADRSNMPYTMATLSELDRIMSILPLSVPHRTTKDVVVLGRMIPKDTLILPNIWAVHHDPLLWGDPHNFRPERFIGPDGQFIRSEHVIPFSMGKRACVGEPMARMEIFLHFVSLLQHFEFVPPDGVMPNLDAQPRMTRRPKSLLVCAKQRRLQRHRSTIID